MAAGRRTLFARLEELGIRTTTVEHAPMFTVEQSASLHESLPGAHTKNLFLVDKEGRMVLVVAKDDTRVDLKSLANRLGVGRLSFGKAELLEAVLGIPPGSVTPLGLINATANPLIVVVDAALMGFAEVNCHPLANSATTWLLTHDLIAFIKTCGHEPMVLPLG
jgi:Ala-tRNA(Pro) deacylase